MNITEYVEKLKKLRGKTIAIIYIFEGEDALGYEHYEVWKMDVLSAWLLAVEELRCFPLVMDARTFVYKAMNKTLPRIDYIVNLNNGNKSISTLGLIPSVCAFLGIPCIPCNTATITCGEHKKFSNIIANSIGLNVPDTLPDSDTTGISRPINLGSSLGIKRGYDRSMLSDTFLYQKFIHGYDITTPILYNPLTFDLEILPAVLYLSDKQNVEWFLGEDEKRSHFGYTKITANLSEAAQKLYIALAKEIGISTYCRIDARLYCQQKKDLQDILNVPISLDKLFFLEINPMPTIKNNINFHTSMDSLDEHAPISKCYNVYKNFVENPTHTGFILSCSILSNTTTKH